MSLKKLLLTLCLLQGALFAYSGGTGTAADPYIIAGYDDFAALTTDPLNWDKSFSLTADIALYLELPPIGNASTQFTGNFNGNSHTVSGLNQHSTTLTCMGLFGYVAADSILQNLNVSGYIVRTDAVKLYAGLIAGRSEGFILDCTASGTVSVTAATVYAGGIAGSIERPGVVSGCRFTGQVSSNNISGGIAGLNNSLIDNCFSSAVVIARNNAAGFCYAGGITGMSPQDSAIQYCKASGVVTSSVTTAGKNANAYAGGLCATIGQYAQLVDCFSSVNVTATATTTGSSTGASTYCGGAVGMSYIGSVISGCAAASDLNASATGASGYSYAGGFIGQNSGYIYDSTANGSVHADASGSPDIAYAGGFWGSSATGTVQRCYSSGAVSGDSGTTGGFGGRIVGGSASACFWNKTTSGLTTAIAYNAGGTFDIIGLSASEAALESTFSDAGWDFDGVWMMTSLPAHLWNEHTVSFLPGAYGSLAAGETEQLVYHGAAADAPQVYPFAGYTFTGWNVGFDAVLSDLVITAQYVYDGSDAQFDYDVNAGYNWLSFPVLPADASVRNVMADFADKLVSDLDKLVSSNGQLAQYYQGQWYGTLTEIMPGAKYVLSCERSGSFSVIGLPVEQAKGINLSAGYNWIGSTLPYSISVEDVFSSIDVDDWDKLISSNGKIAQYYQGQWYGTLTEIVPGAGYSYQCSTAHTLYFSAQ
jgi:hypothetical protein